MFSNFWAELSNDYEKLLETEIGYDVIIYAGEELNVKEIHAHSNILCIRSKYFSAAFSTEWAEKKDGKFILKKPNISPYIFNIILRFIYCGNIELKSLQGPDVLKLLIAVDELGVQQLISHIQIGRHETFTDLWNFCLNTICEEPKILFDSDKFINLKAPLLELLLKRDDLNMNEIEVWEGLLKWCFAQQHVENNPTKWNKDDITKIKGLLSRFIPLIGFYNIEPTDFFYKIYIYKDILPQELIYDLLEFHIVPNIEPKSRATIWVARIQGSKQLIGGYSPLDWEEDEEGGWKTTTDSFIYSFADGKIISTAKFGYVKNPKSAIYCFYDQGPHMGFLYCKSNNDWRNYDSKANCYPNVGIPISDFTVDHYEVFQVIKN
ncbi:hypothetical protein RirG_082310 [Rhizophagus irregularis DAOM 197198w]|uniref:BTB domain-containing protein n=1 Tax=Rhizophagus irregularis (strain DAOM 197198w) TaxID=1432141 RepID=A0A015LEM8_RHIIW|nr:hypothetical protein RirG_082310 [Rhizophagus irregularis DAOM 197198w]